MGRLLSSEGVLQRRDVLGKRPKGRKGAPEVLRHSVQWQSVTEMGSVLL